jgi:hypothetical protein
MFQTRHWILILDICDYGMKQVITKKCATFPSLLDPKRRLCLYTIYIRFFTHDRIPWIRLTRATVGFRIRNHWYIFLWDWKRSVKHTAYILNIKAICVCYFIVAIRLYRIKKKQLFFVVCSCNVSNNMLCIWLIVFLYNLNTRACHNEKTLSIVERNTTFQPLLHDTRFSRLTWIILCGVTVMLSI